MRISDHDEFGTGVGLLMKITLAPWIWAFHFVICYGGTAIWCNKLAEDGATGPLRTGIVVLTLVALAGIAICGVTGWRGWTYGGYGEDGHHRGIDDDESRSRFLSHASVLLSVVSFIGVIFTALPVLLIGSCT